MWFKNLQLYRLTESFDLTAEELHEKMLPDASKPCQALDMYSLGWDKPLGRGAVMLTHATNGCIMICARKEERVLPAAVIRDVLDEKVDEIESNEARTIRRKEKNQLKDEIILDLLPKAFTRSSKTFAYIDTLKGWVIVDSVTAKKAEDVLSLMRHSLGSFKVKPFEVNHSPSVILTDWLNKVAPSDFELQNECELRNTGEEAAIVRLRNHELDGSEIEVHLNAGKVVVKLAVNWKDRLACVLSDDVSIKRLKFLEVIQDESSDTQADDAAAQFDVDFSLMNLELRQFIDRVVEIYGGIHTD